MNTLEIFGNDVIMQISESSVNCRKRVCLFLDAPLDVISPQDLLQYTIHEVLKMPLVRHRINSASENVKKLSIEEKTKLFFKLQKELTEEFNV